MTTRYGISHYDSVLFTAMHRLSKDSSYPVPSNPVRRTLWRQFCIANTKSHVDRWADAARQR